MRDSRRHIARAACAAALLIVAVSGATAQQAPPSSLGEALAAFPPKDAVGLVVVDADTGRVLFAHNPDTSLKPASVQKLFTTAAALDHLGPDFAFETRVLVHAGELWIIGGGDPALCDPRLVERGRPDVPALLDRLAGALQARGLSTLSKIVLDDAVFDRQGRHPDWPDNQAERWYQAPVGGLNLNDNCLDVTVALEGGRVRVTLVPELPPDLFRNDLRVGSKQQPVLRHAGAHGFAATGTVRRGAALGPIAVRDPTMFFANVVKHGLAQRGIQLAGPIVRRELTPGECDAAETLFTERTALADVLWRCNAFSQNMFAEALLKSLAAYAPGGARSGQTGSWSAGREVLMRTLERLGVDMRAAEVSDGCGLCHANRVTARMVADLLCRMWQHPRRSVFVDSLAQPGQPGSMRTRYAQPQLAGRLRGKTGTIAGVHAVAGYVTQDDGQVRAFALLVNGTARHEQLERVCVLLVEGTAP